MLNVQLGESLAVVNLDATNGLSLRNDRNGARGWMANPKTGQARATLRPLPIQRFGHPVL